MIEITSFLLKHLYELMADDYNARHNSDGAIRLLSETNSGSNIASRETTQRKHARTSKRSLKATSTSTASKIRKNNNKKVIQVASASASESISTSSNSTSSDYSTECEFERESDDQTSDDSINQTNYLQTNNDRTLNVLERMTTISTRAAPSNAVIITSREQETNQQIVSFLANNHLPDLFCETFIELLFIFVFLAISWIFVMIVQLHCHQLQQPARLFYCNTKFLASLMYCNTKHHLAAS